MIASAGNSGGSLPGYPARYEGVVAVGAIDSNGSRSSFSNKGGDIWAPGRDVHTIYLDNGYKSLNGTSFSAPYVAAMAACAARHGRAAASGRRRYDLDLHAQRRLPGRAGQLAAV